MHVLRKLDLRKSVLVLLFFSSLVSCAHLVKIANELGTGTPYTKPEPPAGPRKLYDPEEWPNASQEGVGASKNNAEPKLKIDIRSRAEILKLMVRNHSLTQEQSVDLDRHLSIIAKYTVQPQPPFQNDDFNTPDEGALLKEVIRVALNVKKVRGYFPRETQLIAVLSFLRGNHRLLQAGTGQGKSLIVAMTAIVQSKLRLPKNGNPNPMAIHIVTPTDNLAQAGYKENKELYEVSGVRARYFKTPGGSSSDIVYGTPFDFEGTALEELYNPGKQKMILDSNVRRTVILDESDSHLIDGATGRVRVVDQDPDGPKVKKILTEIASRVQKYYQDVKPHSNTISRLAMLALIHEEMIKYVKKEFPDLSSRYKDEGSTWVLNAIEVFDPSEMNSWKNGVRFVLKKSMSREIFDFLERVRVSGVKTSSSYSLKLSRFLKTLQQMINEVKAGTVTPQSERKLGQEIAVDLTAVMDQVNRGTLPPEFRSDYERIRKFTQEVYDLSRGGPSGEVVKLLFSGEVKYLSVETGQIIDRMVFGEGIQEFLEIKYLGFVSHEPTVSIRSYSLFKYVRGADLVLGLSGTVGVTDSELMRFQRHVWETHGTTLLPEFAVPQLKEVAKPMHHRNVQSWLEAVTQAVKTRSSAQPVLVIAENPDRVWQLRQFMVDHGLKPLVYVEMTDEYLMQEKLGPGQIVLATNLGGRGSDYKYDARRAPAGLHVIIGFDSDEERILQQARGRAGRAGAPGTWQQISFGPKLLQKPNIKAVEKGVEHTLSEDMLMEVYLALSEAKQFDSDKRVQAEFGKLVMKWLSNSGVRKRLTEILLQKGGSPAHLTSQILKSWKEYLQEDQTSEARRKYREGLDRSDLVSVRLQRELERSRLELARLRHAH